MSHKTNPHENFVNAMMGFVSEGLLHKERGFIDRRIMRAADISIVKKIIIATSESSLKYFNDNILHKLVDEDEELKEFVIEIAKIDGNGMFTNILLNEFMKAARKTFPDYDESLIAESREFLGYLLRVAEGIYRSSTERTFNRAHFKTMICLAAKDETYNERGLEPYVKGIISSINRGIETVYIFGLGNKVSIAKDIARAIESEDIRIIEKRVSHYNHKGLDGNRVRGVCIEITTRSD